MNLSDHLKRVSAIPFTYLLTQVDICVTRSTHDAFSRENSTAFSLIVVRIGAMSSVVVKGSLRKGKVSTLESMAFSEQCSRRAASIKTAYCSIDVCNCFKEAFSVFHTILQTQSISSGKGPFFFLKLGTVDLSFRESASRAGTTMPPQISISMKNHFRPTCEARQRSAQPSSEMRSVHYTPIFAMRSSMAGCAFQIISVAVVTAG